MRNRDTGRMAGAAVFTVPHSLSRLTLAVGISPPELIPLPLALLSPSGDSQPIKRRRE